MSFALANATTGPSTSGELPFSPDAKRRLSQEEYTLLESMLSRNASALPLITQLQDAEVEQMSDGHMGGLRFVHQRMRSMGHEIVKSTYADENGVPVSLSVNTDEEGNLFELDIWKVDFSPLRRFPEPGQLTYE